MMIFFIWDQLMRHPLIELFSPFHFAANAEWPKNGWCWVHSDFSCHCKRITFVDALTWYLSTSNGHPLCPSSSRLSSPWQGFLNHYCTLCSLAVLGQMCGWYCKLSLLLYDPFWTGIRKRSTCFLCNIIFLVWNKNKPTASNKSSAKTKSKKCALKWTMT